jgi:GT2 family glycosyltransferase
MSSKTVSIIIPLFNQIGFTKVCVEYIVRNTPLGNVELVMVDNASSDGTGVFVATISGPVQSIRNGENLGFAKACNQGAAAATGDYLVFLNNDTAPHPGWLEGLLEPLLSLPGCAMAGPKLLFPDGSIQQAGVVFDGQGWPYHLYARSRGDLPAANKPRYFRALTGACFIISKVDFNAAGGFDERYLNGLEDIDLCLKINRMGKGIYYNPASVLTHFESRSENRSDHMDKNSVLYGSQWVAKGIHDDYRYLSQDGMALWLDPGVGMRFMTRQEADRLAAPEMLVGESCLERGDLREAMSHLKSIKQSDPYNLMLNKIFLKICQRINLADVAPEFAAQVEALSESQENYGRERISPAAMAENQK